MINLLKKKSYLKNVSEQRLIHVRFAVVRGSISDFQNFRNDRSPAPHSPDGFRHWCRHRRHAFHTRSCLAFCLSNDHPSAAEKSECFYYFWFS